MLRREPLLGTRAEVEVTASSIESGQRIEERVLDRVAELEKVFSAFDESSELSRLRTSGTTDSAQLSEVLGLGDQWRLRTERAFDPYCQHMFDAWDRAEERDTLPSAAELSNLVVEAKIGAVANANLNAIAKGWIAEQAVAEARRDGSVESVWLSLGGDVVHAGRGSLNVGVEDPARPYDNAEPCAVIEIENEALATSGGGRRWWTIGGKRWPKVLDPRTAEPVDRYLSATVVASRSADADALATAVLVLDEEQARVLLDDAGAVGLFIRKDGTLVATSSRFEIMRG